MAITVATLEDLYNVRNNLAGEYIQTANIDASPTSDPESEYYNAGAGWLPIGTITVPFTGIYDGGEFVIDGLFINRPLPATDIGLFGASSGAVTKVGVTNCNITGGTRTGALIGGTTPTTTITFCYSTGSVTGASRSGGLFGGVGTATAEGPLLVADSYSTCAVNCGERAGGLGGQIFTNGVIERCYATGSVTSSANNAGGLVGNTYQATISNSHAEGNVIGINNVGGLVGNAQQLSVSSCCSIGAIQGENYVGGLCGYTTAGLCSFNKCYSTGSVSGTTYIGGFSGYHNITTTVTDCYASGDVSSATFSGNFGGYIKATTYSRCYVTGKSLSGYVIAYVSGGSRSNCFYDTQTTGVIISSGFTGKTTAQMKDITTFSTWDIEDYFDVDIADPPVWVLKTSFYPQLYDEDDFDEYVMRVRPSVSIDSMPSVVTILENISVPIAVSVSDMPIIYRLYEPPIEIATFADLEKVQDNLFGTYYQTADIDASITQEPSYNDGKGWQPIGGEQLFPYAFSEFKGVYDGQGYEISGLTINDIVDGGTLYIGLFGAIFQAEISDVHLVDLEINGTEDTHYIGGIAGRVGESTIEGCSVTGSITGGSCIAGIAGARVWSSTISRCEANIQILGDAGAYGGIIGELLENNTITKCYSQGSIATTATDWEGEWIGGLIGYALGWGPENPIVIEDCGTIASVVGASESGGLIGYCMASGDDVINIRRCYAAGSVNVIDSGPAGLTNFFGGEGEIVDCFWDVETTGQLTSAGGTGKTTAEMQALATFSDITTVGLDNPWSILRLDEAEQSATPPVWYIGNTDGEMYPLLYEAADTPVSTVSIYNKSDIILYFNRNIYYATDIYLLNSIKYNADVRTVFIVDADYISNTLLQTSCDKVYRDEVLIRKSMEGIYIADIFMSVHTIALTAKLGKKTGKYYVVLKNTGGGRA